MRLIKNKKSCSYGYSKPRAQTLIKLMKITGMQNVYGEIIYAENSSGLWREIVADFMSCHQTALMSCL